MKNKWKPDWRFANSSFAHYLRFAVIPLAAVLLIGLILSIDRGGTETEAESETPDTQTAEITDGAGDPASSEAEPVAPGTAEPGTGQTAAPGETEPGSGSGAGGDAGYANIDISGYSLKENEVPELTALVRTYCQAKEDCDPELLESLFGRHGLSEEEIAEQKKKMELVSASVKRYENISCYSIEGPEPDTYVIFPYFEIHYRGAGTLMPQLTWAYVTKSDEGRYILSPEVSDEVKVYISRIGEKEEVKALRSRVAQAREEAAASDETLRSLYGSGESEVIVEGGG